MSKSNTYESTPNNVDYANSGDYPTDPDTVNYNYDNANYNNPRPFESSYVLTNYDITNYPKTDYTKFNANLTNYNEQNYKVTNVNPLKKMNNIVCDSPDMLFQVPIPEKNSSDKIDLSYSQPIKYVCFDTKDKLIEITQNDNNWQLSDLTNSVKRVNWQGAQCKINTDKCTKNSLSENCEATCYVSPNDSFTIKYQNNIWRRPDLEERAGSCTMTAISEETAQKSFCKCDNVLERPNLKTMGNMDEGRTGKFWCSA